MTAGTMNTVSPEHTVVRDAPPAPDGSPRPAATPPPPRPPYGSPNVGGQPGSSAPASLVPTTDEWVDLAGLGSLIVLALVGFSSAYGGRQYFLAGVVGTLLGLAVAHLGARHRQPAVVVTAMSVGVFFLFGGAVAVPEHAAMGVLPTPGVVTALIDGVVQGWAKLLTTLPPVGGSGNLLTVPYFCGLVAAVLTLSISRRTRRPLFALVPPVVVLVLTILFGTSEPASLLLQGAAFAAVLLAWSSVRRRRDRAAGVQTRRRRSWFGAATMLLVAGTVGLLVGEHLPGADAHDRYVLRDHTEPPFDPRDHPSPLNAYRRYVEPKESGGLREVELFVVAGLPEGRHLRLATLDTYDGILFSVGAGAQSSGFFQRVGTDLPVDRSGRSAQVRVEVREYSDIWVPDAGELRSITFGGPRAAELTRSFRYNLTTDTAATPLRLAAGDTYTMEVVFPPEPSLQELSGREGARAPSGLTPVGQISDLAIRRGDKAGDPTSVAGFDKVAYAVRKLQEEGFRSDGVLVEGNAPSAPGHGARRLAEMAGPQPIGNGEQYAPTAALLASALQVPARVVMGFTASAGVQETVVTGEHIDAWIELELDGLGWVSMHDLLPTEDKVMAEQPSPTPPPQAATPPPPPPTLPPSDDDEVVPEELQSRAKPPADREGPFAVSGTVLAVAGVVLSPLLLLAAVTGSLAAVKVRRRRRRRTLGAASSRIAAGWTEVTDLATDLGSPVPALATRQEAASLLEVPAAVALASRTDGAVFGPSDPGDAEVERHWHEVDSTRRAMTADLSWFARWKAVVSLSSMQLARARRRAGRHGDRLAAEIDRQNPGRR